MKGSWTKKIIGYAGEHNVHGEGLYCVNCWSCADDGEEKQAAITNLNEGVHGECEVCGSLVGTPTDDEEGYAPDFDGEDYTEFDDHPEDLRDFELGGEA